MTYQRKLNKPRTDYALLACMRSLLFRASVYKVRESSFERTLSLSVLIP